MPLRHMYLFIYIFKPDNCFKEMRIIRFKLLYAVYAVYIPVVYCILYMQSFWINVTSSDGLPKKTLTARAF